MIRDEDLKNQFDYSEGQREASHRVLIELINLFDEYRDDILLVGGWVPEVMFPGEGHIGSVDVDILINHIRLKDAGYLTMSRILLRNGYQEHPDKYFSFVKQVKIEDVLYDVDVDILAGMYGGTLRGKRSQHVQGLKALKTTGGDFAFRFEPQRVKIEAKRIDGALDTAKVNVVAVVPFFVMKTAAMGRGKPKDAYDLYFLVKHYLEGVEGLSKLFTDYRETETILKMKEKLSEKFASPEHAGSVDVANFMNLGNAEETAFIKRDVYELMQALLELI